MPSHTDLDPVSVKTCELENNALDWAVFVHHWKGCKPSISSGQAEDPDSKFPPLIYLHYGNGYEAERLWQPSFDATQGLDLINQYGIALRKHSSGLWHAIPSEYLGDGESPQWSKTRPGERYGSQSYQVARVRCRYEGPDPLTAAMRCLVGILAGETVQVPAILTR